MGLTAQISHPRVHESQEDEDDWRRSVFRDRSIVASLQL